MQKRLQNWSAIIGLGVVAAGCAEETTAPPPVEPQPTFQILEFDATEPAYVSLGHGGVVQVADPANSADWDLMFHATQVTANGGEAGPGGVDAYCHCQNATASDGEVMAFTADGELAAFDNLTMADLPGDEEAWVGETVLPAVRDWFDYNPMTHMVTPTPGVYWFLRTAEGNAIVKFRIKAIDEPQRTHVGKVTFVYQVQRNGETQFGELQELVADLGAGPPVVYLDFLTGSVSTPADWDLMLAGFAILTNGGVSGDGQAGAGLYEGDFDELSDGRVVPGSAYTPDSYGGVFSDPDPARWWFRYNLTGQHQIWPTYNVFAIRRGSQTYKLQIVGYYSETGDPRYITLRFSPL